MRIKRAFEGAWSVDRRNEDAPGVYEVEYNREARKISIRGFMLGQLGLGLSYGSEGPSIARVPKFSFRMIQCRSHRAIRGGCT